MRNFVIMRIMSITPTQFNSFAEAFDVIADVRDHACKERTEQKLTITVANKTYDIKAETTIKYRKGQGIRNWLRKKCGIKETAISIMERRKVRQVGQDLAFGQIVQLDFGTAETISIKCIFNKGKGLKAELRKLDKKLNLQSKPTARQSPTQRKVEGNIVEELKKRSERQQKPPSPPTAS